MFVLIVWCLCLYFSSLRFFHCTHHNIPLCIPAIPFFDKFTHHGYVFPQFCGKSKFITEIILEMCEIYVVVFLAIALQPLLVTPGREN